MHKMNCKTRFLRPVLKSVVHAATAFLALMLSWAALSAIWIWGCGNVTSKFGNEWGNFWFFMYLGLMVFGLQTGVVFVGSMVYALVTGRLSLTWAVVGVLVLVVVDHSYFFFLSCLEPETMWVFLPYLIFPLLSLVFLFVPGRKKKIGHGGIQPANPCD